MEGAGKNQTSQVRQALEAMRTALNEYYNGLMQVRERLTLFVVALLRDGTLSDTHSRPSMVLKMSGRDSLAVVRMQVVQLCMLLES
jgi:hypothetical protein